jgi:hypothetical protein
MFLLIWQQSFSFDHNIIIRLSKAATQSFNTHKSRIITISQKMAGFISTIPNDKKREFKRTNEMPDVQNMKYQPTSSVELVEYQD